MQQNAFDGVNFGSDTNLVSSDNRPMPEPMLTTQLCSHMASIGHKELKFSDHFQIFIQHCRIRVASMSVDQIWQRVNTVDDYKSAM